MRLARYVLLGLFGVGLLSGCGSEAPRQSASSTTISFVPVEGQVTVEASRPTDPGVFAAARLLEQSTWGPTPRSIEEVRRLGVAAWIDQQLLMPPSLMSPPNFVINYNNGDRAAEDLAWGWINTRYHDFALAGQDQLRQRVAWALFNYIPVNAAGPYSGSVYFNLLQQNAFGSYKALLRAVSVDPTMGWFLNNDQNTAAKPNENYARELMQLFSVGLVQLNPDGSPKRDASGNAIETYSQADVVAATKALSGWERVWVANLPSSNWGNFGVPMRPREWRDAHDFSAKSVLGQRIPANQSPEQDLNSLLDILVNHPNTGPFVSLRLIQHLVTSDPSPQYVSRVASVFRSSGGNLGQVVKAILLDPEARVGDVPSQPASVAGKIKEPILHGFNVLRAMGCTSAVRDRWNPNNPLWLGQDRFGPPSVFGYVSPFHRAPESLTLAPEQRLIAYNELTRRLNRLNEEDRNRFTQAGCELDAFVRASDISDAALVALINERFFKGAIPPPLQHGSFNLLQTQLLGRPALERVSSLLAVLVTTPTYGVVK